MTPETSTRFTVVCPIHNEEAILSYTLRSIFDLGPSEIIFGMDRCTDDSEDLIFNAARHHRHQHTGCMILRNFTDGEGWSWSFRPAYLRRELYKMAANDTILNTSADLMLDPKISSYLKTVSRNNYGLISFGYLERNIQSYLRVLISSTSPIHGFAGLLAFSKEAWSDTEDLEELKTLPRGEDTHLHQAISSKYRTRHVNTRSLHLRPNENTVDHFNRGQSMFTQLQRPEATAFLHSFVMLRPAVYAGWRHARRAWGAD